MEVAGANVGGRIRFALERFDSPRHSSHVAQLFTLGVTTIMKTKISPNFRCPSCQGSRLVQGEQGNASSNFVPKGKFMMLGFTRYAVACLDCGYVGDSLTEKDRAELEKKVRDA
jgi:hypothetical protein